MISQRDVNYRGLFILGIAFIPIGIATKITAFIAVGGLFMILAVAHQIKENKDNKSEKTE